MRRELSTRTLGLIAISLAAGSSVFCWALSRRSVLLEEKRERAITKFESELDELRTEIINVGALIMKSSEMASRSDRIAPADPVSVRFCDLGSSPTLFLTYETARANQFLAWYYLEMKKVHRLEQELPTVISRSPDIGASNSSQSTNAVAAEKKREDRYLNAHERVLDRGQNRPETFCLQSARP